MTSNNNNNPAPPQVTDTTTTTNPPPIKTTTSSGVVVPPDKCPLCLEVLGPNSLVLPCGHCFHSRCCVQFLMSTLVLIC